MLKHRVITGVILAALLLIALLNPNPVYWRGFITIAVFIGFWEWLRFCAIENPAIKVVAYACFTAVFYLLQSGALASDVAIYSVAALWVVLLFFTLTGALNFLHAPLIKLVIGIVILSVAGWLIIEFKTLENGVMWVIAYFISVFAADIGAYFVGRKFGKTKLAPTVSPGKTVEGLLGGLAFVALIFTPILFYYLPPVNAATLLLIVLATALVSVGGDLFESKLKRHVGLKDSSQILPGHGGVLDRIDSLLAAAPVFSLGLLSQGYLI